MDSRYFFFLMFVSIHLFLPCPVSLLTCSAHAAQSAITESEGYACMGSDKSRLQTEQQALIEARRNAVQQTLTYLQSETQVRDFQLERDMIGAYSNASIRIVQELKREWYRDKSAGDCFRVKIKAEVTPDEKVMQKLIAGLNTLDDPSAPLTVQVWAGRKNYKQGDKIKIYLKGNKPFYARVLYKEADGNVVQLLPNPFRRDNYFNGGVIYELPSGNDKFDLEVNPPFGREDIVLYTSTAPLGDLALESQGNVYQVKTPTEDIGLRTRGVKVSQPVHGKAKAAAAAEFFEATAVVNTER